MPQWSRLIPMAAFAGLIAISGCNNSSSGSNTNTTDAASAKLAVDSGDVIQAEGAMLLATIDSSETSSPSAIILDTTIPTPDQFATNIGIHAMARYSPAGCLTVTQNGLTVQLVFTNCTGPRGLRSLNGELDETVSAGAGSSIDVAATASGIAIGQTTMDINSSAVYTFDGTTKSMAVTTAGSGTGPLGNEITRHGDYTMTWDANCVATDGSWETTSGDKTHSTTSNVTRCQDQCPTGTITRTSINNIVTTVTFDGSAIAQWTTSDGQSGTLDLTCGL